MIDEKNGTPTDDQKTQDALEREYTDAELLTLAAAWVRRCLGEVGVPEKFAMSGGRLCVALAKKLVEHGHGKAGESVGEIFDAALRDLFPETGRHERKLVVLPGGRLP